MTDRATDQELAPQPRNDLDSRTEGGATDTVAAGVEPHDSNQAPLWLEYLVVLGCSGVLSFGGIGLLLAVIGQFSRSLVLPLGAVGTMAGFVLGRPHLRGRSAVWSWSSTLPAVVMGAVAGGIAAWNAVYIGHHVAVDSDPGVYTVTGRWLADHKSLLVHADAPWSHSGLTLTFGSAGVYPHAGQTVQFQFVHLLPVLLAEAHQVGGDALMFGTPVVLGALGLCAIYLVGCRLVGHPWVMVAAVTALGVSLPELAVTRDTYSEPLTQVLLFFGIYLLMRSYRERRFSVSVVAGLALGTTLMSHIDAVVYLVPLPLLGALAWVAARSSSDRRSLRRVIVGLVVGVVPSALLGTKDLQRDASGYYHDLHPRVAALYEVLGLATVVAVIIVAVWPMLGPLASRLEARRRPLAVAAGWIVSAGLILAWIVRPDGPKTMGSLYSAGIAALQKAENVPVQPYRTYAEQSMTWLDWYIGPIVLALAIAGLCLLTVRTIRWGAPRGLVLLAMTGPVTALYLWDPSITPDQIWAMRRYVPASLPLLVLAAGVALDALVVLCAARLKGSAWPRRIVIAGAVGMIGFPLAATLPVGKFQVGANELPLVDEVCTTIGPHAAVLFPPDDADGQALTQTIRSWCNVPAAQLLAPITRQQVVSTVAALRSEGRTLWVLGGTTSKMKSAVPNLTPRLLGSVVSDRQIRATVSKPANNYGSQPLTIYAARVTA